MRSILVALMLLGAGVSTPAWSQAWTPAGTVSFLQGSSRAVALEFPAVTDFDSATIQVSYLGSAFEDLVVGSFSSAFAPIDDSAVSDAFDSPIYLGYRQVDVLLVVQAEPIDLAAGSALLAMTLQAKSGPGAYLGPTTVFTEVTYSTFDVNEIRPDPQPFIQANIAAIPEPQTWALMLVGVGAVFGWVARRRNAAA